jgi:hypothetical protein
MTDYIEKAIEDELASVAELGKGGHGRPNSQLFQIMLRVASLAKAANLGHRATYARMARAVGDRLPPKQVKRQFLNAWDYARPRQIEPPSFPQTEWEGAG